jgi:hypothetical protein
MWIWTGQSNTWEEANENSHGINTTIEGMAVMKTDSEKDIEAEFPIDFEVTE